MEKLFIGICNSQDYIPADFFWSFIAIQHKSPTRIFRSRHPWDVVRNNIIINEFLKSDCMILAKMDIDHQYPPNYFECLIPLVEKYKVVGGMVYDRWKQNNYMPLAFDRVKGMELHKMNLQNLSGVVEIPYPHTILLYHREVLSKISPPWYEAHLDSSGFERANHVDFTFIEKIHQAGFKVMIDLDLEVKHMTTKFVGKADAEYSRNNIIL